MSKPTIEQANKDDASSERFLKMYFGSYRWKLRITWNEAKTIYFAGMVRAERNRRKVKP